MRDLTIKVFADGADITTIRTLAADPLIKGFTTNPTLMRKAGVTNYRAFALEAIEAAAGRPISFEVFADDFPTMAAQAREIASWGDNVYVKIPVVNSVGETSAPIIRALTTSGIKVNVTAVMTFSQIRAIEKAISGPAIVSIFAGRIADCGFDPEVIVKDALSVYVNEQIEVLWASPREMFNVIQARRVNCHIITLPPDMIRRFDELSNRDLGEFSRETVAMFRRDALAAGYDIPLPLEQVA